jgi:hypothetical protein
MPRRTALEIWLGLGSTMMPRRTALCRDAGTPPMQKLMDKLIAQAQISIQPTEQAAKFQDKAC